MPTITAMITCLVVVVALVADVSCDRNSPPFRYVAKRRRDITCSGGSRPLKGGCITKAQTTTKLIDEEANDGQHEKLKTAVDLLKTNFSKRFDEVIGPGSSRGLSYEETKAIFLYTMDDSSDALYADFNRAFREGNDKYPIFHYWLQQGLANLQSSGTATGQLYRGYRVNLTTEVNAKMTLPGFTSFSESRHIAETMFAKPGCTLMILTKSNKGVKIADVSLYPGEAEVLVPPSEQVKVTTIAKEAPFYVITLKPTGNTEECSRGSFHIYSMKLVVVILFCNYSIRLLSV